MIYNTLDIYNISFDLFIEIHRLLFKLPKHELYELGSQIRRSADSVNSNIVEGYGRRMYKNDYLRFPTMSHSSCDETINHIKKINILYPEFQSDFEKHTEKYKVLSAKLYTYIEYVRNNWRS